MWLRDSLPERLPGARTLIYGYQADVYSAVQTGRIRTYAETFLERLRHLREDSAVRAPFYALKRSMAYTMIPDSRSPSRPDRIFDGRYRHQTGLWSVLFTTISLMRASKITSGSSAGENSGGRSV